MWLAVDFKRLDVDRMLRELTAKQYREWIAYRLLEPFGELRDDYRTAKIEARLFNLAVSTEHRKKVEDFLLKFEDGGPRAKQPGSTHAVVGPRTQSLEEQAMIITLLAYAMAGEVPPGVK